LVVAREIVLGKRKGSSWALVKEDWTEIQRERLAAERAAELAAERAELAKMTGIQRESLAAERAAELLELCINRNKKIIIIKIIIMMIITITIIMIII
jgi:hypothetical protein